MFINFPYKKLTITCKLCEEINKNPHRDILVKQIFREGFKLVIEDIINTNATFHLPTGAKKCDIHMRKVTGNDFKYLRLHGKWKDVDFIESNFSGYLLSLYMYGLRDPRIKPIYLNKDYRNKITENTNKGFQYGEGSRDTYLSDYLEAIYDKYPSVPKSDIKRILTYGWKSLYLHNSYGGDVFIKGTNLWCYIGFLKNSALKHFNYYIKKLCIKLRVLYKRKKIPWDGYYYFAVSENLKPVSKKKGRPKTNFVFKNIFLYLILDECKISEFNKQYIYRIPYISSIKFKLFVRELKTNKAELICKRDPLKFKDILVYINDYEFL